MYGDQGLAFTGPGVFQTTLNWPSALTSPMKTDLCRWWFFSSILDVMQLGAVKVWPAMAGQTFTAPSGITSKMDEKNHHLHKSVFIGEVKADGQFNVVWKTPGPVKAKPWSPYIEGNDVKPDEPVKK